MKYREIDLRKTGDNDLRSDRPNLFYPLFFNKKTQHFYVGSITAERVKRVVNGYADMEGTGGNFSFYDLGEPLLLENQYLNERVSVDKIREYVYFMETKQLLPKNGDSYYLNTHNNKDAQINFQLSANDVYKVDISIYGEAVPERKGFCLNGFINHYADFMVMTRSGTVVLIETKGDHLANDDSKQKLSIGRLWEAKAGNKYRYFMVFKNNDLKLDGAYVLDEFVGVMKKL